MTTEELQKTAQGVPLREVMQLDWDARVEGVDGKLEMNTVSPGYLPALIIEALYDFLKSFVQKHAPGRLRTDGLMYLLHVLDENKVRYARIPADFDITRPFPGPPTLAVEVVSAGENNTSLQGKVRDHLTYGTEAVWAVYPQSRTVTDVEQA
jgi:Uma2 family endonuclease